MSKALNKYIIALDYAGKTLFAFSGKIKFVSLCSFTTAIVTLLAKASANISLVLHISNGIIKMILTTMRKKKSKHRKI